jgi:hypothetical protein
MRNDAALHLVLLVLQLHVVAQGVGVLHYPFWCEGMVMDAY